ncbi:MAG: site-2 protease family protein, partial [Saprospiraceae bacterium]
MKSNKKSLTGNSLHLGTFAGIPVKVHWTFGLLILFVIYTTFSNGWKMGQSVGFIVYVLALFLCVVLHEYGHALTARRFGVGTQDILLSPIGGVARLRSMPDKPMEEFFIAIAGPLVNVVIGSVLAIILLLSTGIIEPDLVNWQFDDPIELLRFITYMNFALFFFNLIPAFPMDGGRILRSLLAAKIGKVKATRIASFIGRVIAIGFVIFGIFNQQVILALIGLFIFTMAGKEYDQTKIMSIIKDVKAGDIMRTKFSRLHLSDSYTSVIEKYYREGEQNFLVFDSLGYLSGTVPELFIKDIIKNNTSDKSVQQMMSSKKAFASAADTLIDIIEKMKKEGVAIVAITDDSSIVG